MKVLWFTNTPALASNYLNHQIKGSGGWLVALDLHLQRKVELSVAFTYPFPLSPFKYNNTNYFPVYTGNIIFENIKKRWFNKVYDKDFLTKYLNIIETVKPDIIHIHGTENSFSCILENVNIPIVVSIQGNLTVYYHKFRSGLYGDYIKYRSSNFSLKAFLFDAPNFHFNFLKMGKMARIEQIYLKKTKYIIGRTDWDKRIMKILAPYSKYYVGNEILRDVFYENQWEIKSKSSKIIIHTTNSNNYYKGFETLCLALTLLNEVHYDIEWRVAGITHDCLINKIVKKHLGVNYPKKGLMLLGSLTDKELVMKLKESHIYVMTSHIENSPNNLCEAMLLGMPCIATFSGGTGSLLTDKIEGVLIQDGDPWVMAGAILELIENWGNALQLGANARKRALVRHNCDDIVNSLIKTYSNIINETYENFACKTL